MTAAKGTLHIVGVGPGDPELMTLKAARLIAQTQAVAYFAKPGRSGHARTIAAALIPPGATELRFDYPFTTEIDRDDPAYQAGMDEFHNVCATRLSVWLDAPTDIALLCEGDPLFYGSSLAMLDRLGPRYRAEVTPGVTGMSGCWASASLPMTHGDDVLTVLPGTLDQPTLTARLTESDAAVIVKLGRNLPKIRAALRHAGKLDRAVYVERGCMPDERIVTLAELTDPTAPYFALILVPGRQRRR